MEDWIHYLIPFLVKNHMILWLEWSQRFLTIHFLVLSTELWNLHLISTQLLQCPKLHSFHTHWQLGCGWANSLVENTDSWRICGTYVAWLQCSHPIFSVLFKCPFICVSLKDVRNPALSPVLQRVILPPSSFFMKNGDKKSDSLIGLWWKVKWDNVYKTLIQDLTHGTLSVSPSYGYYYYFLFSANC